MARAWRKWLTGETVFRRMVFRTLVLLLAPAAIILGIWESGVRDVIADFSKNFLPLLRRGTSMSDREVEYIIKKRGGTNA